VPAPTTPIWTPTPEPVVSVTPTLVSPWTAEEQAVIDAVTRYLSVWSRIGQDLEAADWNEIRDVAVDPLAQADLLLWVQWQNKGWHLVGEQTFVAQGVTLDKIDDAGSWYSVDGCASIVGSDLVDAQGQSAGGPGRQDIASMRFTVLSSSNDGAFVGDSETGQTSC